MPYTPTSVRRNDLSAIEEQKYYANLLNQLSTDDSTLTDAELQKKNELLQEIGRVGMPLDKDQLIRQLQPILDSYDVQGRVKRREGEHGKFGGEGDLYTRTTTPGIIQEALVGGSSGDTINEPQQGYRPAIEQVLASFIQTNRRLPDVGEFRDVANSMGLPGQDFISDSALSNFLNDQNAKNRVASELMGAPPDNTLQEKNLSDLLSGRKKTAASEQAITDFTSGLPQELASQTDKYIQSQKDIAQQGFQEQTVPEILNTLNIRGVLQSGSLAGELASAQADILGGLESQHADLLAQDLAFFQNAGYQNQLRRAVQSGQDVTSAIGTARDTALQTQQQSFKASETALNRTQQQDLFRRQQERALQAQQQRLQMQQDLLNKQKTAALASSAGSAAGTIIGASTGGVPGAIVGGSIGGTAGGFFGG